MTTNEANCHHPYERGHRLDKEASTYSSLPGADSKSLECHRVHAYIQENEQTILDVALVVLPSGLARQCHLEQLKGFLKKNLPEFKAQLVGN